MSHLAPSSRNPYPDAGKSKVQMMSVGGGVESDVAAHVRGGDVTDSDAVEVG